MTYDTIGIDISKDHLDAHRMRDGASRRFANDRTGHQAFIGWVGQPGSRIVYEPTGPYHRTLERKQLVPQAQIVDVSGAGHMVAGDKNDAFADAILGFLGQRREGSNEISV